MRNARLSRALPWLIAAAFVPLLMLLGAAGANLRAVIQGQEDARASAILRDRSLWLWFTAQHAPHIDISSELARLTAMRSDLRLRDSRDVAATDPSWNAFADALGNPGQVDWRTVRAMRNADAHLTDAFEGQARAGEAHALYLVWNSAVCIGVLGIAMAALLWDRRRSLKAQEQLAAVLDATPDYVAITDSEFRLLYLNRAFRRMLGVDEEGSVPELDLTQLYAPWSWEHLRTQGLPAALRDGSWVGEVAFLDPDGWNLPMSQSLHVHRDPRGGVRLSTILRDIQAQKSVEASLRAEQERLAAIAAVQRAVAHADLDVDQVMLLIAEGAQALVHADGSAVETLEGDSMVYRVATGISAPHRGLRIPMTNPLLTACLERREVQYCADAEIDPRANRAACQAIGCRSTLLAPVYDGPVVLGVLVLQSIRPHAFTEADAQTLQLLAEMVASTMRRASELETKQALLSERTDAMMHLQESQDFFLSSLEAMQEGLMVQDHEGTILMCNKSAARILGVAVADLVTHNAMRPEWRFIHEDGSDFPHEAHPTRLALKTGMAQHNVIFGIWQNEGTILWLLVNAAPLFHVGQETPYAAVQTFTDVTERKQIQQQIGRLAAIVESTEDAVFAMTLDGTLVSWNKGAEGVYGYAAGEVMGEHGSILVPPGEKSLVPLVIQRIVRGEDVDPIEVTRMRKDGTVLEIALSFSPIRNASGETVGLGVIGRDITAWKQTEQALRLSEARLNLAQQIAGIGNWEYDVATGRMQWSREMFDLLEFDPADGAPAYDAMLLRFHPEDRMLHDQYVQDAVANGISYEFDLRTVSEDETIRWVHMIGHCLCNEDIEVVQLHGTLMEVTERKIAEQRIQDYAVALEFKKQELEKVNAQLASLASTDALTNLSNRRAFQIRLEHELERADRYNTPLSLVILDVDNFKLYNDAHGHPAGDDVLRQVAQILQDSTREFDLAARYGGEEFVVIFPHTDSASAMVIAERCRVAIEVASWEKRSVTASFGVATMTPGMDGATLVALADEALYSSKANGRNRVTHGNALESETQPLPAIGAHRTPLAAGGPGIANARLPI